MKRFGSYITIALFLTLSVIAGCSHEKTDTVNETDAFDMEQVLGSEQMELMQEYEIMEMEDEAITDMTVDDEASVIEGETYDKDVQAEEDPDTVNGHAKESVTVVMVGDILLHTPIEEAAYDPDADKYNYDFIFDNTRDDISGADIAIVNQEVIIGGRELGVSGYPAFNAPDEIGDALVDAGFDVICHATNHALDKGARGIVNCADFWDNMYPDTEMLGIHQSGEDSEELCIMEKNGIRIAILNYTYGTNGIPLPSDMPYAVDMLDKAKVEADLKRAEEEAEFTIVIPHWGVEYSLNPSADQRKWAEFMAKNGADLIIGAHPHVIEPIEWIYTEDDDIADNDALCYYSLGNFVNWTSGTGDGVANRMVGGMAKVSIEKDEDGLVRIADHTIIPLICHVQHGREGVRVYRFDEYSEELADSNEIRSQDPAFSYKYCEDLIQKVWE